MKKRNAFKHNVLFFNVHYSHIKKHISSYLWQHNKLSASIICSNNRYANQDGHTIECYKNFMLKKTGKYGEVDLCLQALEGMVLVRVC